MGPSDGGREVTPTPSFQKARSGSISRLPTDSSPPSEQATCELAAHGRPPTPPPHLSQVFLPAPQGLLAVIRMDRGGSIAAGQRGSGLHLQRRGASESWCGCDPPGRPTRLSSQHRYWPPLGTSQYSSCSEFACYRTSWKPAACGRECQVEPSLRDPSPSDIRGPPGYLRDGDAALLGKLLFGLLTRVRVTQVGVEIFVQDLGGLFAEVPAFASAERDTHTERVTNSSIIIVPFGLTGQRRGPRPTWRPGIGSAGS